MFDIDAIIQAGWDLVGWRGSESLKYPASGLFSNDLPGVSAEIIQETDLENYLRNVHEAEIAGLVHSFLSNAKQKLGSTQLLSNFNVVNGVADYTNLATKNARFVGWVINPYESNSVRVSITKIGVQLDQAQDLRIYLYCTDSQEATVFDVKYTKPLSVQWFDCPFTFNDRSAYIMGYYERDPVNPRVKELTASAVKFDFDCNCNNSPSRTFGKYVTIKPITIPNNLLNGVTLPVIRDLTSYYDSSSYGMFAKINVSCDLTEVLVDNIDVFAKAMQYSVAIRILDDFLLSTKMNNIVDLPRLRESSEAIKNKYWAYLNGWVDASGYRHKGIIDDITMDFSGIDRMCLPCKKGVKIGYMGRP